MKKFALLFIMSMIFTSCSLLNDKKVEAPSELNTSTDGPIIELENNIKSSKVQENDTVTSEENTATENTSESGSSFTTTPNTDTQTTAEISSQISTELQNETESEAALNEVFNELLELSELAEQSGGQ